MDKTQANKPDYQQLIDQDTWTFINLTLAQFPENAIDLSITEQRNYYNSMCQFFNKTSHDRIEKNDYKLGKRQVKVRHYTTHNSHLHGTTLLYFHGGGFIFGDLESHDSICEALCGETELTVIACDYCLAPEHTYSAALLDVLSVFDALTQSSSSKSVGTNIVLVGDSAGATLAACLSAKLRSLKIQPKAQVLIYPYLGAALDRGSAVYHADAPLLSTEDVVYYEKIRLANQQPSLDNGQSTPLKDTDFSHLPKTIVFCAECDPLCDDGEQYCSAINAAGGDATCIIETGLVHGYLRARHYSAKAKASFNRLCNILVTISE